MSSVFTYYIDVPVKNKETRSLYIDQMIPLWVKLHESLFKQIFFLTNIPDKFDHIPNIIPIPITLEEAYCDYDPFIRSPTTAQVGCWKKMLSILKMQEAICYLDTDAFLLNDRLLASIEKTQDYKLAKKKTSVKIGYRFGDADSGTVILRKTTVTLDMIHEAEKLIINPRINTHIENYCNNTHRGNSRFYFSWNDFNLMLRDLMCGSGGAIDCIHGIYSGDITFLNENQRKMINMIKEKEKSRKY